MKLSNYFTLREIPELLEALQQYMTTFPKTKNFSEKTKSLVRPLRAFIRSAESEPGVCLMLEICYLANDIYRRLVPEFNFSQIFFAAQSLNQIWEPKGTDFFLANLKDNVSQEEFNASLKMLQNYIWIKEAVQVHLNATAKIENPLLERFFILLMQHLLSDLSADSRTILSACFNRGEYLENECYYYEKLWNSMKLPKFTTFIVSYGSMTRERWSWQSAD